MAGDRRKLHVTPATSLALDWGQTIRHELTAVHMWRESKFASELTKKRRTDGREKWARPDLNRRPSGYEPDAPPG